jgi:16S rRNA (uracil1498-N3)-methyltransferase
VSAPLFLLNPFPDGETCTLDGPEGHHAATVQRLRVGERLLLSDGRGLTAEATVRSVGRGTLELTLGDRSYEPEPDPRIVVVQGIAKGDRGELAVQAMTEVGVDEIVPWSAARSVMRWQGERGEKSRQRWADTAREATKQARRSWLALVPPAETTSAVADRLRGAALAVVLHEEASDRLATVDVPATGDLVLVIGPEGGITDEELAAFTAAGAVAARLGPNVLRTSTAGVAAVAALASRLSRW